MKTSRQTPPHVIRQLLQLAELRYSASLLEPSAGEGDIIKGIIPYYNSIPYKDMSGEQMFKFMVITGIELNKEKFEKLASNLVFNHAPREGKKTAYHGDFLNYKSEDKYSKIVAAPPFNSNSDVDHIKHMFYFLEHKGILVSLTSPYWLTNNEPRQVAFREWLAMTNKSHEIYMLPDNTFIEKGKTVPTAIIKIKREV